MELDSASPRRERVALPAERFQVLGEARARLTKAVRRRERRDIVVGLEELWGMQWSCGNVVLGSSGELGFTRR